MAEFKKICLHEKDLLIDLTGFALKRSTTSVTISISISQIFRSLEATFHLRPTVTFLFHNFSDTPGVLLLWIFFFEGDELLGHGHVKEHLKSSLRKLFGQYGDLNKQYEVPFSRMLHDILKDDHIQWQHPLIRHNTNLWPCYWTGLSYWTRLFAKLREV